MSSTNSSTLPGTAYTDPFALREAMLRHARYSLGRDRSGLTARQAFEALALALRNRMVDRHIETEERVRRQDAKRLYYLSMEFLIGQSLGQNLLNLHAMDEARAALEGTGHSLEQVCAAEPDAALGNGGLGRLAACFVESMATLGLPGYGCGINYEYGLFRQEIRHGAQVEKPDNWLTQGTPWQIERADEAVVVPVYGRLEHAVDRYGFYNPMWLDWQVIVGVPRDMFVPGHGGSTVNYLRLYAARASEEFELSIFNEGEYLKAVEEKVQTETITKVLYPADSFAAGRELRLIQEYFLVACSIRDIVRRYERDHASFDAFADKVAIQLNDTHPALAVAELMRVLIDENDLEWEQAWEITRATFGYTNHTLMPEALEKWPVDLVERVIPRHLQIIYEINAWFMDRVARRWPGDMGRMERMSLIEEGERKQVRMAHLAIVGSHSVNGVSELHSRLVRTSLVPDFSEMWPERFSNKTNGVTARRWLGLANPGLAGLITDAIGERWITHLDELRRLEPLADDPAFQDAFVAAKRASKQRLAAHVRDRCGVALNPDSMFDVQAKRIHEYKRQLLNIMRVAHDYLRLVDDGVQPASPRACVFAGKAAPGYWSAKQAIRLISAVGRAINQDPRAADWLRVAFVPDYRVTLAELMIPAADLSEQISTAGTEASGTGNMKFAMNGALTMGTLDGANIEIAREVGAENIFVFGLTVEQADAARAQSPRVPAAASDPTIGRVMEALRTGRLTPGQPDLHAWVHHTLVERGDPFLHGEDMGSYVEAQQRAAAEFADPRAWARKAILNVARSGIFSSDRTINEYATDIWRLEPARDDA